MDQDTRETQAAISDFLHDMNGDVQQMLGKLHEAGEMPARGVVAILEEARAKAIELEKELRRKGHQVNTENAEMWEITLPGSALPVKAKWTDAVFIDERDRTWIAHGPIQARNGGTIVELLSFSTEHVLGVAKKKS